MKNFDRPTQVKFADPDNVGEFCYGIAYNDEIICACCGGVFPIDEIDGPIIEYADWVDFSDYIK